MTEFKVMMPFLIGFMIGVGVAYIAMKSKSSE